MGRRNGLPAKQGIEYRAIETGERVENRLNMHDFSNIRALRLSLTTDNYGVWIFF